MMIDLILEFINNILVINRMASIYIKKKKLLINGKKRRVYKKKGSKKLYLKHKGRMVNVVKYKKYLKRKQKKVGGIFFNTKKITFEQRANASRAAAVNFKNRGIEKYKDYKLKRRRAARERERDVPDSNPYLTRQINLAKKEAKKKERDKQLKRYIGKTKSLY